MAEHEELLVRQALTEKQQQELTRRTARGMQDVILRHFLKHLPIQSKELRLYG